MQFSRLKGDHHGETGPLAIGCFNEMLVRSCVPEPFEELVFAPQKTKCPFSTVSCVATLINAHHNQYTLSRYLNCLFEMTMELLKNATESHNKSHPLENLVSKH